jgi:hypothetical protein
VRLVAATLALSACAGANPARDAIDAQSAEVVPAAAEQAPYYCPMHPEVTSDQPGKCPKCGMDLVKRGE